MSFSENSSRGDATSVSDRINVLNVHLLVDYSDQTRLEPFSFILRWDKYNFPCGQQQNDSSKSSPLVIKSVDRENVWIFRHEMKVWKEKRNIPYAYQY